MVQFVLFSWKMGKVWRQFLMWVGRKESVEQRVEIQEGGMLDGQVSQWEVAGEGSLFHLFIYYF